MGNLVLGFNKKRGCLIKRGGGYCSFYFIFYPQAYPQAYISIIQSYRQ